MKLAIVRAKPPKNSPRLFKAKADTESYVLFPSILPDLYNEFAIKRGTNFCVYAVYKQKPFTGEPEYYPFGEIEKSKKMRGTGGSTEEHPDRTFFNENVLRIRNGVEKLKKDMDSGKIKIDHIEIHSTLLPCPRKYGCSDFLQQNLMDMFGFKKIVTNQEVWVISYKPEGRKLSKQVPLALDNGDVRACLLNNMWEEKLGDPENGYICVLDETKPKDDFIVSEFDPDAVGDLADDMKNKYRKKKGKKKNTF